MGNTTGQHANAFLALGFEEAPLQGEPVRFALFARAEIANGDDDRVTLSEVGTAHGDFGPEWLSGAGFGLPFKELRPMGAGALQVLDGVVLGERRLTVAELDEALVARYFVVAGVEFGGRAVALNEAQGLGLVEEDGIAHGVDDVAHFLLGAPQAGVVSSGDEPSRGVVIVKGLAVAVQPELAAVAVQPPGVRLRRGFPGAARAGKVESAEECGPILFNNLRLGVAQEVASAGVGPEDLRGDHAYNEEGRGDGIEEQGPASGGARIGVRGLQVRKA